MNYIELIKNAKRVQELVPIIEGIDRLNLDTYAEEDKLKLRAAIKQLATEKLQELAKNDMVNNND